MSFIVKGATTEPPGLVTDNYVLSVSGRGGLAAPVLILLPDCTSGRAPFAGLLEHQGQWSAKISSFAAEIAIECRWPDPGRTKILE